MTRTTSNPTRRAARDQNVPAPLPYIEALRARDPADRPAPVRVLALLSGGLDSLLSCKLLMQQRVEVVGVNFNTGFCGVEYRKRLGEVREGPAGFEPVTHEGRTAASQLGIEMHFIDISLDYLDIVMHPRHGYGSAANPCVDCRIFMLRAARGLLERFQCHSVVTGEVLGQRPKSQRAPAMRTIEREAGLQGLILRPLSARLLPATLLEEKGWIDRDRLGDFSGRGRKAQFALARELGVTDYPTPAGGCCMLVEQAYANRFFDFLRHRGGDAFSFTDITLLRIGRHFRIGRRAKLIVGRDELENRALTTYRGSRPLLSAPGLKGPVALLDGVAPDIDDSDDGDDAGCVDPSASVLLRFAGSILARYCQDRETRTTPERVRVSVERQGLAALELDVTPADAAAIVDLAIVASPKKRRHRGGRSRFFAEQVPAATLAAVEYKAALERRAQGEAVELPPPTSPAVPMSRGCR